MVFTGGVVYATSVIQKDFNRQAIDSNLVVIGKLAFSYETTWRGYPCTVLAVDVERNIAGDKVGSRILLLQPGTRRVKVVGVKRIETDKSYLLMLEKLSEGYYRLVGFNQGAHSISIEKRTGRRVINVRHNGKKAPGMTLEAAIGRVTAVREFARTNGAKK